MIIELDKLSETAARITGVEKISVRGVADTDQVVTCSVDVSARKSGEAFYFQVSIEGTLSTPCHKCLRPTNLDIRTQYELVVHRGGADKAREDRSEDDDFVYIPIGEQQLSLDQSIYENLMVNIPMRIVCSEDCRGLCPNCGANLNEEPCTCPAAVDSRWEALAILKKKYPKSQ
jgi:uncharacterized protein